MKKFLLFVAVAAAAMTANAEQGLQNIDKRCSDAGLEKNFVVNGNFDDPSYKSKGNPYWDDPMFADLDELTNDPIYKDAPNDSTIIGYENGLPGWTLSTGGCWNGICQIRTQEPDDWFIFEGNTQYLQQYACTVNGWTKIKTYQQIEGLTAGTTYRLDLYVRHSYNNTNDWANPTQGITIYDKPLAVGENGKQLYEVQDISEESEWEYYIYDFTAANDAAIIELWSCNYNGENNSSGVHTVDWDEVRVYDPDKAGINNVMVDAIAPQEVYTLQGIRVNNNNLKGVYIVKNGNKTMKVRY